MEETPRGTIESSEIYKKACYILQGLEHIEHDLKVIKSRIGLDRELEIGTELAAIIGQKFNPEEEQKQTQRMIVQLKKEISELEQLIQAFLTEAGPEIFERFEHDGGSWTQGICMWLEEAEDEGLEEDFQIPEDDIQRINFIKSLIFFLVQQYEGQDGCSVLDEKTILAKMETIKTKFPGIEYKIDVPKEKTAFLGNIYLVVISIHNFCRNAVKHGSATEILFQIRSDTKKRKEVIERTSKRKISSI